MADKVGKIDLDTFKDFILKRLGNPDRTVIVPPMTGVDAGVVDLEDGRVLIIAEDPIFMVPGQPLEMFGWYTVHIGASDVAVMGVAPRYMTYSLLMPPGTPDRTCAPSWTSYTASQGAGHRNRGGPHGLLPRPRIAHHRRHHGLLGVRQAQVRHARGRAPGGRRAAHQGPRDRGRGHPVRPKGEGAPRGPSRELVEKAKATCMQMTVVRDALVAMRAGGVTAMHDATEGGVIGGLFEIANASGVGMEVDESRMVYPEEVKMVAEALRFDAQAAIAEGTLLLTVRPSHSEKVIRASRGRESRPR